jgi:hypothetical protein
MGSPGTTKAIGGIDTRFDEALTIYQNQVAATLTHALRVDYAEQHPNAGRPIAQLLSQ